jgi:hypothetical protein
VSWEASILAMGVALGAPADEAAAWIARPLDPRGEEMLAALRSARKAERARTLALTLGAIARDIETLDWTDRRPRAPEGGGP